MQFGGEQAALPVEFDWRYRRVVLMELTGWDFATIDELSFQDEQDIYVVLTAREEARRKKK